MSDPEYERYRATLAEIITSDIVGGLHLRRVGELLVARERMNERAIANKDKSAARSMNAEFVEQVLIIEEKICTAWDSCREGTREWRREFGLKNLADALRDAADFFDRAVDS